MIGQNIQSNDGVCEGLAFRRHDRRGTEMQYDEVVTGLRALQQAWIGGRSRQHYQESNSRKPQSRSSSGSIPALASGVHALHKPVAPAASAPCSQRSCKARALFRSAPVRSPFRDTVGTELKKGAVINDCVLERMMDWYRLASNRKFAAQGGDHFRDGALDQCPALFDRGRAGGRQYAG